MEESFLALELMLGDSELVHLKSCSCETGQGGYQVDSQRKALDRGVGRDVILAAGLQAANCACD